MNIASGSGRGKPRSNKLKGKSGYKKQEAGKGKSGRPGVGRSEGITPRQDKPWAERTGESKTRRGQVDRRAVGRDRPRLEKFQAPLAANPDDIIFGRNPVREAIKAGRSINKILVAKGSREGSMGEILALARQNNVRVQEEERSVLDNLVGGANHQGIAAYVAIRDYADLDDLIESSIQSDRPPFFIILDEVEDPHNLGAILRTAECSGAHGVIIPKRRSASLTSTVAKASAGAVEYIPVARVANLAQAVQKLKSAGIWIVGSDSDAPKPYFQQDMSGPLAIIVGSEGKGMGRLLKEKCDYLVSIPMKGKIGSLNASVAGAVLMYERMRQQAQFGREDG